ncbi:MAG: N-acetylglucosamine-6-phosphate deacetylase [Chloroflexota bacterium]
MSSFSISGRALIGADFVQATLAIADGRISALRRGTDRRADTCADGWIAPGLIDLQVNGAYGFDFTVDSATLAKVAARLPATGVTAFLPTIITSPLDTYPRFLRDVENAAHDARGAQVLGAHLEGPYLSAKRVGAHNPNYLRAPNRAELETWAGSPQARVATLAPELPGALDLIRELCARGVVVSAGHSNASYAQARAGFDAGITWGTHLFNAMPPFSHREPGLIGALLSSDVPVGLIADGVHVHPAALKTVFRAKGARGITLVTDAMMAMGLGPGRYTLGDREVIVDAMVARLDAETLAGSILQMDAAIRNVIEFTGCSLAEALTMASATPARVLGLANKGRIAEDCDADLVILDKSLRVEMTIARGEVVYERKP